MKCTKVASTSIILFLLIASTIASIWFIFYRKNLETVLENFRMRRSNENATSESPPWISNMMEAKENRSQLREEENVLATALAKLLITSPEDIMNKFITDEENFGCKKIDRALNVFKKNFNGDLNDNSAYVRLFRSLGKFHQLICGQNEKYRIIFTPSQDEMVKLHEQFLACSGEMDWYEKNETISCVEAQKILDCYHEALVYDVGEKVSYFHDYIFKQVINAALNQPCKFNKLPRAFSSSHMHLPNIFIICVMITTFIFHKI